MDAMEALDLLYGVTYGVYAGKRTEGYVARCATHGVIGNALTVRGALEILHDHESFTEHIERDAR